MFATKPPQQPTGIDKKLEKEISEKKIEARPDEVSTQSSVRHAFEGSVSSQLNEKDVTESVAADLVRHSPFPPAGHKRSIQTRTLRKRSKKPSHSALSQLSRTLSVWLGHCLT